ncbi:DUF669 domain-containing protein [Furfurilactobacillus curtus]|uniref:DUF669 domain-containing protein n=1 Tax=Furfurilactobacillus curtus TaxID=1746200 RepID=A0ABQ5JK93_9LACO
MAKMHMDYDSLPKGGDYDALPAGDYEMVINKVEERATKSGAESLQLDLIVRNDLDKAPNLTETNGQYHNRHVFLDNWKRKKTNEYDTEHLPIILKAAGFPDGKDFDFPDDFINFLYHKPVRVSLKNEENTYKGNTTNVNRAAPWDFSETEFPQVQHQWKKEDGQSSTKSSASDPFASNGVDSIDVSDDGLPF